MALFVLLVAGAGVSIAEAGHKELTLHPRVPSILVVAGEDIRLPHVFAPFGILEEARVRVVSVLAKLPEGARISLRPTAKKDRYGRRIADVMYNGQSLTQMLVAKGGLLADPAGKAPDPWVALQQTAADNKIGIWRTELLRVRSSHKPDTIKPGFVRVRGRVLSVGVRQSRVYLNFGRRWKTDFTASAARPLSDNWLIAGRPLSQLNDACVEITGVAEARDGPYIALQKSRQIRVLKDYECALK